MSKSHNTKEQKYCICFGVGIVGSCLSGLKDINKENIVDWNQIYCEVVAHCELHHCLRKNIVV